MRKMSWKRIFTFAMVLVLTSGIIPIVGGKGFISLASDEQPATPTPISTDTVHDELLEHIRELMSTNFDCHLPCFGGLEPGKADTSDIEKFINKIDYNDIISSQLDGTSPYNFELFFNHQHGLLTVGLSTNDDILQRTSIGVTNPSSWLKESVFELPEVVKDLGSPENVFMEFSGPPLSFTMVLVYNKKGVLIRYQATFNADAIDDNHPLPICFSPDKVDLDQIDVWLQSPDSPDPVEDNQYGLHDSNRETRPFWSLQKVTGLTEAEFGDFFTKNPDGCIDAPSPYELKDEGYNF